MYETLTLRKAIDFINELNITELLDAFLYPNEEDAKTENWQKAMDISLNEFEKYFNYKDEQSPYVTQQGSKGLEYDHVMVIMNDNEAGGRLFHFGKVYGTTEPSKTDSSNEKAGKDNAISRTKRLLYVAASRAKESLGLVIYSPDVDGTKGYFLESGLVRDSEIVTEEDLL